MVNVVKFFFFFNYYYEDEDDDDDEDDVICNDFLLFDVYVEEMFVKQ